MNEIKRPRRRVVNAQPAWTARLADAQARANALAIVTTRAEADELLL